MLFNSYEFIFMFLPITFFVYFLFGKLKLPKLALATLTVASLLFYSYWDMRYLPLLLLSIVFNYTMGGWIGKKGSKNLLITGVVSNLLLLGYFKYTNFFLTSVNDIFQTMMYVPNIILPLGISFFTFTQIAYLVDSYRGETKNYKFLSYILFVTVFPHLIAGPVLYHKDIIPQFSNLKIFSLDYKNIALGLTVFGIGLMKKVVIADTLAPWANLAFDHVDHLTFIEAWSGAIAYTFQIYFDFSGYSEMAIGLGLLFNLKLPINFNSPYRSTSIIDFWRRWHMSLCAFLKYYVYIPLGGNRCGEFTKMKNIFITMLVSGIWHGAGWTYIIWGCLHGVYTVINHLWRKTSIELPKIVNWGITFLCVIIAWVFFRAENVSSALKFLHVMFDFTNLYLPTGTIFENELSRLQEFGFQSMWLPYWKGEKELVGLFCCLIIALRFKNVPQVLQSFRPTWGWLVILSIGISYAIIMINTVQSEFIYFQF